MTATLTVMGVVKAQMELLPPTPVLTTSGELIETHDSVSAKSHMPQGISEVEYSLMRLASGKLQFYICIVSVPPDPIPKSISKM
jgi:hypothetical protein